MKRKLIIQALNTAKKFYPKHPQRRCYAHYSFVIQDGKIVEWATNTCHIPPVHHGFHRRLHLGVPKTHSEWNAFRRARGLLNKKKPFEVINIRLGKNENISLSKPCSCCYNLLKEMGCKVVCYSCESGFEVQRLVG